MLPYVSLGVVEHSRRVDYAGAKLLLEKAVLPYLWVLVVKSPETDSKT